jgi:hypothetical protein
MNINLFQDWNTSARVLIYPGALCCLLMPVPGMLLGVGLLLFGLELVCFVQQADRSLDLRVLLRMAALLFMWVSPALSYTFETAPWYTGYHLAVKPDFYFALVIPCTAAFNLALSVPVGAARASDSNADKTLGWFLLSIGLIIHQISPFLGAPSWIQYMLFLTGQLWLVGLVFVQRAYPIQRWWILGLGLAYLFYGALQHTLFGHTIIWSVILLCNTLKEGEIAWKFRWGAASFLAISILFLLSFKYEYRQKIWHEQQEKSNIQVFLELAGQRLLHPADLFNPEIIQHYTDRLNQGYHTAMTMAYVPAQEPYAWGATLLDDFKASLLPRLLAPDKHRAGGKENIRRFSGVTGQRWSSNIGHYGEAYVNFGVAGAWLVMLLYGLLISAVFWVLRRYFPLPCWAFVLEPVLNVEQDIGIGMNHLSKAMLVVVVVWAARGIAPPCPPGRGVRAHSTE